MELSKNLNKEQKQEYITVSEYTWGCVPIDVDWAKGTSIYKQTEAKLLLSGVMRTVCPQCEGKGWYYVNEWIGTLQGRKDCSCKGKLPS